MFKKIILISSILASSLMAESSFVETSLVKISKSEPKYETVFEKQPYENCYDVKEDASTGGSSVLGTVAGGAIGGVLGHQVGGGSGKTAATIGGAIIGSIIGNKATEQPVQESYKVIRKCDVSYREVEKKVVNGYVNYFYYKGKEYQKITDKPINNIEVENYINF